MLYQHFPNQISVFGKYQTTPRYSYNLGNDQFRSRKFVIDGGIFRKDCKEGGFQLQQEIQVREGRLNDMIYI